MTDDHKPLPVAGYTSQPDAKVAVVNLYKQLEEVLLREIDAAEKLNKENGENTYDPRWLAVARTHLQIGFMALNRAVFQPQRIRLPEDE